MARSPRGRICGSGCVDEWSGAGLGCAGGCADGCAGGCAGGCAFSGLDVGDA